MSILAKLYLRLIGFNTNHFKWSSYRNPIARLSSQISSIKYSDEDRKKILDTINQPLNEINSYNIAKHRIKKIESWKLKNGPFESLDQVLEINGFGNRVFEKFCDSILKPNDKNQNYSNTKRLGNLCTPTVPEIFRSSYKSCVALHVGLSSVTWTILELNELQNKIEIKNWRNYDIIEKNLRIHDLSKICLEIDELISDADCYVMESPQILQTTSLSGNVQPIRVNVQYAQLLAMLSFGLMKRNHVEDNEQCDEKPKLFYLRRFLSSKLYGTFVGTEKVSTKRTVLELMKARYNVKEKLDEQQKQENSFEKMVLLFPNDVQQLYKSADGHQQEFLGQSLLLGLTFIRLCLLKCSSSLVIIEKQQKLGGKTSH